MTDLRDRLYMFMVEYGTTTGGMILLALCVLLMGANTAVTN